MGYATVEKTTAGFKAVGERIDGFDSELQEMKELGRHLQKQLKRLYQTIGNASGQIKAEGRYGPWASEEEAKMFGYYVLVALGREKGMNGLKDMGEITETGGGVLVPTQLHDRLIDLMPKYGKFRANATVLPVGSGESLVPQITSDLTIVCPGEGGAITKSDGTLSLVKTLPKTWAAIAAISNELDEDSVGAIGIIVGMSMARSMSKKEDACGFVGDGSSTYFGHYGVVGAFKKISETLSEVAGIHIQASGTTWAGFALTDFEKTAALLPAEFDEGAKWHCSKRFYWDVIYPLATAGGNAGIFELLSDKKARAFLGYEVDFNGAMATETAEDQIPCILGDLSAGAYLAERKRLTLQKSDDVYFGTNQIGIRGIQRVDFNVFGVGSTSTPGPIVALATGTS